MIFLYDLIFWFSILSYLIPIGIITFHISKTENRLFNVLLIYPILCFLTEIISLIFRDVYGNNNPILHIYTFLAFPAISLFYYRVLLKEKILSIFVVINFLFLLVCLYSFFITPGAREINKIPYLFLTLYVLFISCYDFYKIYTEMKVSNLFQDGLFWVNSAFLIYFSSTFYVSLFEDIIKSVDLNLFYYTWPIQLVSTIIFNVILSRGIWLMRKQ